MKTKNGFCKVIDGGGCGSSRQSSKNPCTKVFLSWFPSKMMNPYFQGNENVLLSME